MERKHQEPLFDGRWFQAVIAKTNKNIFIYDIGELDSLREEGGYDLYSATNMGVAPIDDAPWSEDIAHWLLQYARAYEELGNARVLAFLHLNGKSAQ